MNIQLNEKRILDAFITLLQIPSISQHEKDVASYIKHRCNELHIDVLEDDTTTATGSNVGNIICNVKGTCDHAEPIFFSAHMDTIEKNNVKPIIENGYIQTNGSTALGADDKAGVIAILEAIHYLKNSKFMFGDIQLIFTVCEEQGLIGSRSLNKDVIKGKYGYTIDADEPVGTLITHSPAISIVIITVFAQQSDRETTVHESISSIVRSISKSPPDEKLDVTIIGFQENNKTGVGAIDLTIKLKSFSSDVLYAYIQTLDQYTKKSVPANQGNYTLDVESICTSYAYTKDDQIIKVPTKAAGKIGLPIAHTKRIDVSDANILTSTKTPTMNIGVGYENIHTTDERMAITQLYDLIRFIIAIAVQVANK